MSRRIAIPLVVLAVLVASAVLGERTRVSSPQPQARVPSPGLRPPAPTAVEEAGEAAEVPPPTISATDRVPKPPRDRSVHRSAPAARPKPGRPAAPRVLPRADGAPPAGPAAPSAPPRTVATQHGPDGSSQVSEPAPKTSPVETAPVAEPPRTGQSAQSGKSGQAPELGPPVLLSEVREGYPPDGYLEVVDRGTLTPGLRVEAAEGRTVLKVLVRMDGTVGEVIVLASSGYPVLDQAAVDAARRWRFQPATRDGEPVDAWAVIPVRFVVP